MSTWKSYAILLSVESQQKDGKNSLETNLGPQIKLEGRREYVIPLLSVRTSSLPSECPLFPFLLINACLLLHVIWNLSRVITGTIERGHPQSLQLCRWRYSATHPTLLIHSSGDGHFSCFHFLPSMNNAILCIREQSCCVDTGFLLSSISLERELLGYVVMQRLTFWGTAKLSPKTATPLSISTSSVRFEFLHILSKTCSLSYFWLGPS